MAGLPSETGLQQEQSFFKACACSTRHTRRPARAACYSNAHGADFSGYLSKGSLTTLGGQCALLLVLGTQALVPASMREPPLTLEWIVHLARTLPKAGGSGRGSESWDSAGAGTDLVRVC